MDLYNDFYEENDEVIRDKSTQLKHKAQNTFVFESFTQKLSKLKFRLNEDYRTDVTVTKLSDEMEVEGEMEISADEQKSNFKNLLEREKAINNFTKEYNLLSKYTVSYVYYVNNYKKVLDILTNIIEEEINSKLNPENKIKALNQLHNNLIKSAIDLIIAVVKDLRSECYEYFMNKCMGVVVKLLNLSSEDNLELIDQIFQFFVNVFKFMEKSITKNFKQMLIIFSEILFHSNKFIRKFSAQSLCYIIKNLDKDGLVDTFDFLFNLIRNPQKIFETEKNDELKNNSKEMVHSKIIIKSLLVNDTNEKGIIIHKLFLIDCLSEIILEVLCTGNNISIKADLILNKISSLKCRDSIENKITFILSFIKLIKRVNEKHKLSTIALFHYFVYSQYVNNEANYKKLIRNTSEILEQLKLFDLNNENTRLYLLLFARELLCKNFKEENRIYFDYANEIITKILSADSNGTIEDLEISIIFEIISLILKLNYKALNSDLVVSLFNLPKAGKKVHVNCFLKTLINLNNFSFYQSFSIFSLKNGSNVDNAEYETIEYDKEKIIQIFNSIINDVKGDFIDFDLLVNITTTYKILFIKFDHEETLSLVNKIRVNDILNYIYAFSISGELNDINIQKYIKVISLINAVETLGENKSLCINVMNNILDECMKCLSLSSNQNNDFNDKLTNILLNEFYNEKKYFLNKTQAYISILSRILKIYSLNQESIKLSTELLSSDSYIKSFGFYYILESHNNSDKSDKKVEYLVLLSPNLKYKIAFINYYKRYFYYKYSQEISTKYSTIISETFDTCQRILNITFDYQNDKKYTLNFEIIVSKVEVLLANEGMSIMKKDFIVFILYFFMGSYWINMTKSVWPIISRGLERIITYLNSSAALSTFECYKEEIEEDLIGKINQTYLFMQKYSNENDFVSKSGIKKSDSSYIIFSPSEVNESTNVEISYNNLITLISKKSANEFKTISTFFDGLSTGLSQCYSILLNTNEDYKKKFISTFNSLCSLFSHTEKIFHKETQDSQVNLTILYNYIVEKETKTSQTKLKENLVAVASKLNYSNDIETKDLLFSIYNQIIYSRSVQIQKLSIDTIAAFDTKIKPYTKLLYKIIENTTVISELINLKELKTDNGQKMKDIEKTHLIPLITRLYYSKYFKLNTENLTKMKTKNKINLVNYFIQLDNKDFEDYLHLMMESVDISMMNFNIRNYKKFLEILKINVKQITKLFEKHILSISEKVKSIFLYLKNESETIKKNKESYIDSISNEIIKSGFNKTKYFSYYNKEEILSFTSFYLSMIKEIKKETFNIFNLIFNKFYYETELVRNICFGIAKAYQKNMEKLTSKENSIYRFFISLSKHARLHFVFRENNFIFNFIIKALQNKEIEKKFMLDIIDFIENIASVFDGKESPTNNAMDVENSKSESDDNEEINPNLDAPITKVEVKQNFDEIIIKNFDVINNSLTSLMTNQKISPRIKDSTTKRIVELLLNLWNLHSSKNSECVNTILKFLIQILEDNKIYVDNNLILNSILRLCHILIIVKIKENSDEKEIKNLYEIFVKYLIQVQNFNSRIILCVLLQEFALNNPKLNNMLVMVTYLNTIKKNKRDMSNEIDTDFILTKLAMITDDFIIDNIDYIKPMIYQLIILSSNSDFAVSSISTDKAKMIFKQISALEKHKYFYDVNEVLFDIIKNKFSLSQNVLMFIQELNSVHQDLKCCSDLCEVKSSTEEEQSDGFVINMLLNFKYDIRIKGLKILISSYQNNKISYYTTIKIIIPLIRQFINARNYIEDATQDFNIKYTKEVINEIVIVSVELLIEALNIIQEKDVCDILCSLLKQMNFVVKNNKKFSYTVDVFKMTNEALTAVIKFVINKYFPNTNKYNDTAFKLCEQEDFSFRSNNAMVEIYNKLNQNFKITMEDEELKDNELYQILTTQIYPTLKDLLYDTTKEKTFTTGTAKISSSKSSVLVRNYIITPFILVSRLLPGNIIIPEILRLAVALSNSLTNFDFGVRERSRLGIENVIENTNPYFVLVFLDDMSSIMQSGHQKHILGYSANYILKFIKNKSPSLVEAALPRIMPIIFDEIFGDVSEEKKISILTSKSKEAKSTKSFNSLQIICSEISISQIVTEIMFPLRNYFRKHTCEAEEIHKLNELNSSIIRGIKESSVKTIDDAIENSFILTKIGIERNIENANAIKKMKGIEVKGNNIYTFDLGNGDTLEISNAFLREKNDVIIANVFVVLGLEIFLSINKEIIHSNCGKEKDNQISKKTVQIEEDKLNDLILNVIKCLKFTNNTLILSLSIKILISLFDIRLPIIKKNLAKITKNLFKNLLSLNSTDIQSVQSVLKCITDILTKFTFIVISNDKIKALIDFLKLHLSESQIKPYVFSVFNAMIKRKMIHPSIYEMIDIIKEIVLSANDNNTKNVGTRIICDFLIEYPLEQKAKNNLINFFVVNTESCRLVTCNSIRILATFVERAPKIIENVIDFIIMKLFYVFSTNDDDEIRGLIKEFLSNVYKDNELKSIFSKYYDNMIKIVNDNTSKEGMTLFGISSLSLITEMEFNFIKKDLNNLIDITIKTIKKECKNYQKGTSSNSNVILFYLIIIIQNCLKVYGINSFNDKAQAITSALIKTLSKGNFRIISKVFAILPDFEVALKNCSEESKRILVESIEKIVSDIDFGEDDVSNSELIFGIIVNDNIDEFLINLVNSSKRLIARDENGNEIVSRILKLFKVYVDKNIFTEKGIKATIEFCYRAMKNSKSIEDLKKNCSELLNEVKDKLSHEKFVNAYKEAISDVNFLKKKRKMEEVERYKNLRK